MHVPCNNCAIMIEIEALISNQPEKLQPEDHVNHINRGQNSKQSCLS